MRLNHIRDFLAVVDAGSLRAAARAVGVSQPAMTKSLQQLEQELHVRLLQRSARGVVPTVAGKTFLARARVVQAELRKIEADLDALGEGNDGGAVAFGVAPMTGNLFVPEAMSSFRRTYPRARVRIVEGVNTALLPQVRDETLDFSIGQKVPPIEPAIRFRPLFRLPLVVACRKGHPMAGARSLRELAAAPWLMFYPLGSGGKLEQAFSDAGLTLPTSIVQCESFASAQGLIAKTDTLGLLSPHVLAEPQWQRVLQKIDVAEPLPSPTIGIYTRAGAPLTRVAAALVQGVVATGRKLARADLT
jgi:DNA-binding transcriptional LysR family regulator